MRAGRRGRRARQDGSLLAAIVESSSDAIVSATLEGVITSWNAGATQMYGYAPQEMIGRSASVLLPPERAAEIGSDLGQVRRGERVSRYETQRVRKDGTVIDVWMALSPVRDDSGAVTGVVSVTRDVTERNRAIETAGELQSRLTAIVQSSPDGVIGKTLDGVITSWNAGAAEMYGYGPDEMIGHNVNELIPADRAGELGPILDRIRHALPVEHFETQRVRKDGTVIEVSVSVSPICATDGTVTGAATVARDITERNRAIKAAAELQSRLAAIVESSADAIIGYTLNGTITSWNSGAQENYGYTAEDMIGHNMTKMFPPELAAEFVPVLARIRRGERVGHYETKRVRKDRTVIDVSVSISPVRDAEGTVVGASSVARDITERLQAEAERRAGEQRLHMAERLETVGQLAGGIAHDFNNLLAAILGFAGLLGDSVTDTEARADVEQIKTAAQRAAELTKGLLVFSRRDPAKPVDLDLNEVIAGEWGMLAASVGDRVDVRVEPAVGLPAVHADARQLEQVLLNLAVNARDAMPDGGVLTITTVVMDLGVGDPLLQPGTTPGQFVELRVSDTGTGMRADVAARIFEPFFTTKPVGQGTGLGLSTVYGTVTSIGGCITVESAEGTGTTFRIFLPAVTTPVPAAAADSAPPAQAPGPDGEGKTVLVVDDEPAVLEITSRILHKNGYITRQAHTWQEALSLVSSHDFALMVTDSVMPGMSGLMLADQARELRPGLPVLHMTGSAAGTGTIRRHHGDSAIVLQKPFTADALLAKVRTAMDAAPQP